MFQMFFSKRRTTSACEMYNASSADTSRVYRTERFSFSVRFLQMTHLAGIAACQLSAIFLFNTPIAEASRFCIMMSSPICFVAYADGLNLRSSKSASTNFMCPRPEFDINPSEKLSDDRGWSRVNQPGEA